MKSFWSLILRYIFSNKKRISFIAVGIVFSISLIIALNIMLDSLTKSSIDEMIKFVGGDYDIVCQRADENVIDTLNKDTDIEKKTVVAYLGQCKIPDTIYNIELNGYEPNVTEIFNFKLTSGRYPKNNNEIALESWIVENMPQKFKIGDKIKLQTKKTIKNNKGKWEDIFLNHEFILVGTFNYIRGGENLTNIAEGYITKGYVESIFPPKDIMYSEYFTINPKYTIMEIYEGLSQIPSFKNNEFHMNYFKVNLQQILKSMDFISMILYIIICIVASVIIYNIFSFSVTERVREFGMLRAIGASTRDIKTLVIGEGLIIGVIFIPVGIIFGNIAVKLIIAAVSGYKNYSNFMQTPKTGLIASIIVGFASILIGVYLPSRKAGKISAIEAINSNNNLELHGKKIKESIEKNDKIYNAFGLSPVMAKINLRRNKNRFTTTIVSLSICITMFLMVSYIINCTDPLMNIKENLGGDFVIYSNEYNDECSLYNDDIKKITDIKGITKINKVKFVFLQMKVAPDKVTQSGIDFLGKKAKENTYSQDDLKHEVYKFNTEVYGYSKEDLELIKNSLKEGKIDIDKMQNDPIVILGQNLNYGNNTNLKVGDKINLYIPVFNGEYVTDYDVKTFTIGAMLKSDIRTRDASLNNMVIMSDKLNERYNITKGYQIVTINVEKNSYDNVEKSLREIVKYKRVVQLKTYKEELEKAKKQYLQFSLIMYSFVIIAALVSIINLINIMNMNVVLRKRELGMLRSQGFSRGDIRNMINTEGFLYGLISSVWGIGLGLVFSYLFFLISRKALMQGMTWKLPLGIVLGTFAAVIIICVLAAMNSTRRVFNSSIIDSVRTID